MKRILAWGIAGLLAVAVAAGVWARFLAGGPVGPFPGGALSGRVAETLPDDWSFANQEDYVTVESRAGRLPYSQGVWFMAYEGRVHLLLPSFFGDGLKNRLDLDPRARACGWATCSTSSAPCRWTIPRSWPPWWRPSCCA